MSPRNRIGGVCLVAGSVVVLGAYLITPGAILIDPVDTTDYVAWSQVLGGNPAFGFLSSISRVLGTVLQLYGLFILRRGMGRDSIGDLISRFGVMSLTVGSVVVVAEMGLIYGVVHTLENGLGTGDTVSGQLLNLVAVTILAAENGISLMAYYAFLLGLMALGVGVLLKVRQMGLRVVSIMTVLSCFASLVFVTAISPFSGLVEFYFWVFAMAVVLGNVWFVMLGMDLYRGLPELVGSIPGDHSPPTGRDPRTRSPASEGRD